MALVNCPECGQQISNMATHCPHCGIGLKLCPECNNVTIDNLENCTHCGFLFFPKPTVTPIKEQEVPKVEEKEKTTVDELYQSWMKEKNIPDIFNKRWIYTLLALLGVVLFLVPFLQLVPYWKDCADMNDWEQAVELLIYEKTLKKYAVYFWLGAILEICVTVLPYLQNLFTHISLAKWLPNCKKDYKQTIVNAVYTGNAEPLTVGAWLADNPKKQTARISTTLLSVLISIAGTIVSTIFFLDFMDSLTLFALQAASKPSIGDLCAFLICLTTISIITSIIESRYKTEARNWRNAYYNNQQK